MIYPTHCEQVNSRGYGEHTESPHILKPSPESQALIDKAVAYIKERGGAQRKDILKHCGQPPGAHWFLTLLLKHGKDLYVGDPTMDHSERADWIYYDGA